MASGQPQFSADDLAFIRIAPRATIGGHMTFPSGLKTNGTVVKLGDDFESNVKLAWSIIEEPQQWVQPPTKPRGITFATIFQR